MNSKFSIILLFMTACASAVQAQDYKMVWSDEFDSNSLHSTWNVEVMGEPYNNELQYYTSRTENVKVEDGNLVITARREQYGTKAFTSARVNTLHKVFFTHGRVEARIKLPRLANGLWPAFWMMGEDFDTAGWPACGEIDIMEMGMKDALANDTQERSIAGAIHWGTGIGAHQLYSPGTVTTADDITGDYHVFTAEWDDEYLKFYVDNAAQPYFTATIKKGFDRSRYFHKPMYLLLNLAVGGDYTGILDNENITALKNEGDEAKMYVDYVRIYQKEGSENAVTGVADTADTGSDSQSAYYNMLGIRTERCSQGIVIHEGKKVIK